VTWRFWRRLADGSTLGLDHSRGHGAITSPKTQNLPGGNV